MFCSTLIVHTLGWVLLYIKFREEFQNFMNNSILLSTLPARSSHLLSTSEFDSWYLLLSYLLCYFFISWWKEEERRIQHDAIWNSRRVFSRFHYFFLRIFFLVLEKMSFFFRAKLFNTNTRSGVRKRVEFLNSNWRTNKILKLLKTKQRYFVIFQEMFSESHNCYENRSRSPFVLLHEL